MKKPIIIFTIVALVVLGIGIWSLFTSLSTVGDELREIFLILDD